MSWPKPAPCSSAVFGDWQPFTIPTLSITTSHFQTVFPFVLFCLFSFLFPTQPQLQFLNTCLQNLNPSNLHHLSNAVETSAEISMAISKGWTWPSSKKFVPTYRPPPFSQTLPFLGPNPLSKSCLQVPPSPSKSLQVSPSPASAFCAQTTAEAATLKQLAESCLPWFV